MIAGATLSRVLPLGTRIDERGHLELGGCDAVELARRFGTPAYVVVEDDLRQRARTFLRELQGHHPGGEVLFASKSFPCTAVGRLLAQEGLGCEVASGGELAMALKAGFDPVRIHLHGNANSREELRQALEARVGHVVLDSFDELALLERLAGELGRRQRVLLRVTPDVAGETHAAISTGQADSKFGFTPQQARAAIERLRGGGPLELVGLHVHIGSQLLRLSPFQEAIRAIAGLGEFELYNLGGGLGVAYTAQQPQPPSIADYVRALVQAAHARLGSSPQLVIEPGRSLVANSTVTLYTVQSVKRNVSTWVAVDGGMSDNLRPMLYGARYEALIADRPRAAATESCHVVGKHCESGDVIVRDAPLADPAPGDVLVTPATGAYGHALANNYNGVPRPPVIFCSGGCARLVLRRETYADLLARDVEGMPGEDRGGHASAAREREGVRR